MDHSFTESAPAGIAELPGETGVAALARMLLLAEWCSINGSNAYAVNQRASIAHKAAVRQAEMYPKLQAYLDSIHCTGFEAADFRAHAEAAVAEGAAILAYPPTYRGGYERMFKRLHAAVKWDPPSYGVFDPKDLSAWVQSIASGGTAYAVVTDQLLEGMQPTAACKPARNKMVYIYAGSGRPTWVAQPPNKRTPFRFEAVDGATLTRDSVCTVIPVSSDRAAWIKDRYLAKSIESVSARWNYLVWVDGKLAGAFGYAKSKFDTQISLYLMFDLAVSRDARLSKLVALLASCAPCVRQAEEGLAIRVQHIETTAFTKNAVSMKYRGVWDLIKRGEGFLNYRTKIRPMEVQDAYRSWFDRYRK